MGIILDLRTWRKLVVTLGNSGKYTKSYLPATSCIIWIQVCQMLYCVVLMLLSTYIITMVIERIKETSIWATGQAWSSLRCIKDCLGISQHKIDIPR